MSANVEGMVREGVAALKAGRKDEARTLLSKAVELDQYNEQAWLWLSGLVDSPEDQRICLENVLAINPANDRARKGLAYLEGQSVDFSPPQPKAPPASPQNIPTSVEWDLGAAAANIAGGLSTAPREDEVSSEVYDKWVSDLNLPANANDAPRGSTVFTGDVDDDMFAEGPFTAPNLDNPANARKSLFDFSQPVASLKTATSEDQFGAVSKADAKAARQLAKEKKREDKKRKTATNELKKASGSSIKGGGEIFMPDTTSRDYTLFDDMDSDADGVFMEEGEGELFGYIPSKIRPTRIPGTKEGLPFLGILLLLVLIALNIGAVGLLIIQILPILNPA